MLLRPAALLLACALLPAPPTVTPAAEAFERLKMLAGQWTGTGADGTTSHYSYEVVAGGSALLERCEMPHDGVPVTMLTLFTLDGSRLLLTHYCMAGNQPRMQARSFNPDSGELEFQFLDATNLAAGAGHMHGARFRLIDNNHFSSEWDFYENGQRKFAETAQYTRVR